MEGTAFALRQRPPVWSRTGGRFTAAPVSSDWGPTGPRRGSSQLKWHNNEPLRRRSNEAVAVRRHSRMERSVSAGHTLAPVVRVPFDPLTGLRHTPSILSMPQKRRKRS